MLLVVVPSTNEALPPMNDVELPRCCLLACMLMSVLLLTARGVVAPRLEPTPTNDADAEKDDAEDAAESRGPSTGPLPRTSGEDPEVL